MLFIICKTMSNAKRKKANKKSVMLSDNAGNGGGA